ncbi:glycosyltransferase family 39 protein [candidate division WWE3 bacterium]|uniref:Glycosyltransferase family 39 protein n=1 Tax=candidate division WWE3 bacterium TaxID=2053526 RepID=A0A955LK49_UNCKA|nr:glycosyltransferase family 39 protein [candidate division WWE3 bacterium]
MRKHLNDPRKILLFILLIGAFLRFYKFNWGDGFFFHPDERNIAFGISNLNLEKGQFNPEFWAYGSLPIYIIYLIAWVADKLPIIKTTLLDFNTYILIGRLISALASTLIIFLIYKLVLRILHKNARREKFALLAALLVAFLPGMIQFAHFMTFETFLTLEYIVMLWLSFNIVENGRSRDYLLLGIVAGLSVGTKIVSLSVLPILIAAHVGYSIRNNRQAKHPTLTMIFNKNILLALIVVPVFTFVASPFHVLDLKGFVNSFNYESGVADGSLLVFYTQQFLETTPVIYQLTKVFPYILTMPLTLLSIISLCYIPYRSIRVLLRRVRKRRLSLFAIESSLVVLMALLYLAFHLSLFVKWTRYMIPALPFLVMAVTVVISQVHKKTQLLAKLLIVIVSVWAIGSGVYFFQIYLKPDTRVESANWANTNLATNALVSSEIYDLGIMPFNSVFNPSNIDLLPLYDLEVNPQKLEAEDSFADSQYFIELSQRVWRTRERLFYMYPESNAIYTKLRDPSAKYGWQQIMRDDRLIADCNIFTLYCFNNTLTPDETFTVFDHPTLRIYENIYR